MDSIKYINLPEDEKNLICHAEQALIAASLNPPHHAGAAILTACNNIYIGSDYASFCAGQSAIANAMHKKGKNICINFTKIAIISKNKQEPCGTCREAIYNCSPNIIVLMSDPQKNQVLRVPIFYLYPQVDDPINLDFIYLSLDEQNIISQCIRNNGVALCTSSDNHIYTATHYCCRDDKIYPPHPPPINICTEQIAINAARLNGDLKYKKLAIFYNNETDLRKSLCGKCRQTLSECADISQTDILILMCYFKEPTLRIYKKTISQLHPK